MVKASTGREWRQFRLLWRDSARRVISAAMLSREADPAGFALWTVAAITVPPSIYAFNRMLHYTFMGARWRPEYELIVLADRTFFVLYGMLASAMLAALLWEALLPDTTDQEVIGPLPVRARTLVIARLAGAVAVALALATAVSVPSGLLFAIVSATHPAFGWLPVVLIAHVSAIMAGSLFVFGLLFLCRAAIALFFGVALSERLALALQLVVVSLILSVVFFLPAVLSWHVTTMLDGGVATRLTPPIWFVALYSWTVGTNHAVIADEAVRAALALGGVAALIIPICVLPAGLFARRSRESRGTRRSAALTHGVTAVVRALMPDTTGCALVSFTIISLARSQRHLLLIMSYAGAGIAIGAGRLVTSGFLGPLEHRSEDAIVLLLPLVLMMFLIAALRTAFAIPTELDANWTFRLSPPSERTTRSAALTVVFVIGVTLPILLFATIATMLDWPYQKTVAACAFDATVGLVLTQVALKGWRQIPFAREHKPNSTTIQSKWLGFLSLLVVLGFMGAQVQEVALRSVRGTTIYLGVVVAAALGVVWRYRARNRPLEFDAHDQGSLETLGLSGASA